MKKLLFPILLLLLGPLLSHGQHLIKNPEELNGFNTIPKETVFVHYNDNLLLSGEYLYYKIFCLNAKDRTPSKISKIGYVELLGKNGVSVFKHKIRLATGVGQGEFFIPVNIASGHYKLTGYTQWMLNDGVETIFVDDVIIINPFQELPQVSPSESREILKLVKKDSASRHIDSIVFSKKSNTSFEINLPKKIFGKRELVTLKILNSGSQNPNGHYSISVRKKDYIELPPRRSAFDFVSSFTAPQNVDSIKIRETISQSTVQGELISGRIISKVDESPLPYHYISLSILGSEDTAEVFMSDANGIFRFKHNESNSNNIILEAIGDKKNESKIILDSITPLSLKSSDLVSDMKAPQNTNEIKIGDQIYLPELRGELISGKILSIADELPVSNQDVSLSISGEEGLIKISRSDVNGVFYFNLDGSDRKSEVLFEILENHDDESKIILDSIAPLTLNSTGFKELTIAPELNPMLQERSILNQVESAFFEQKADSSLVINSKIPVYRDFQEIYTLDEYNRFKTLRETLIEIIENVFIKKIKGKLTLQVRGEDEFFVNSDDTPLLLVDGIMLQDLNNLLEYDIKKIDQINISRSEYFIGPKRYQGIVSIVTKQYDYAQQVLTDNLLSLEIDGPHPEKEYYFQNYHGQSSTTNKHIADFRRQLLWQPKLELKQETILEFFTSDKTGDFEIRIEGFTSMGKPVSLSETIHIE